MTPEERPLEVFGQVASEAVERRIGSFVGATVPDRVIDGALVTHNGRLIPADAVIALPSLHGPFIGGLPHDEDGFLSIDAHARVTRDVFAAGVRHQRAGQAGRPRGPAGGCRRQQPPPPRPAHPSRRDRSRASCAPSCSPRTAPWKLRRDLDAPAHKLAGRHLTAFLTTKEHV